MCDALQQLRGNVSTAALRKASDSLGRVERHDARDDINATATCTNCRDVLAESLRDEKHLGNGLRGACRHFCREYVKVVVEGG